MSEESRAALLKAVVDALIDKQGIEIVALDIRELADYADIIVIASGSSERQVQAMADGVEITAKEIGERPIGTEGYAPGRWVLVDYGDVVVHLFHDTIRDHYDLEGLWSEAPRIPLELPVDAPRRAALY